MHGLRRAKKSVLPRANFRSLILVLLGRLRHCRVEGESMVPELFSGDVVLYRPLNSNLSALRKGSIVVASHPKKSKIFLIKRVNNVYTFGIELLGDNQERSTDSRQFGLFDPQLIRGTVEFLIPIRT